MASSEPVLRNGEYKVGEHQPRRWNDLGFSILFVAHLFGMASATAFYVPMASEVARGYATNTTNTTNSEENRLLQQGNEDYYNNNQNYYNSSQNYYSENDNNDFDPYYSHEVTPQQILALVGGVGVISLVICSLNLQIMVCCAKPLIKIALICNALSMCIMAIMSFANGMVLVGVIGAVFAFLAICFACSVWQRIPFAASNLAAATTAIRQNLCVTSFAYLSVVISFLWNLWWFVTVSSFVAVKYFEQAEEQNNNNDGTEVAYQADPKTGFIMFFFFVSYYWTYQVIKVRLNSKLDFLNTICTLTFFILNAEPPPCHNRWCCGNLVVHTTGGLKLLQQFHWSIMVPCVDIFIWFNLFRITHRSNNSRHP